MGPHRSTFSPKPGLARTTTTKKSQHFSRNANYFIAMWQVSAAIATSSSMSPVWSSLVRPSSALHLNLHSQNLWEWTVAEPCARCVAGQTAHKVPAIRRLLRKQIQVVFRHGCAGIPTRHRMEGMEMLVVTQDRHSGNIQSQGQDLYSVYFLICSYGAVCIPMEYRLSFQLFK